MIEVYARRRNTEQAANLVRELQAQGHNAREQNVRWFDPRQADSGAAHVYHDGTEPAVLDFYEALGVPCEIIPGLRDETAHGATQPDYTIEETRGWYKLVGPDGEQVGKSQRSEDEAWALMDEVA